MVISTVRTSLRENKNIDKEVMGLSAFRKNNSFQIE